MNFLPGSRGRRDAKKGSGLKAGEIAFDPPAQEEAPVGDAAPEEVTSGAAQDVAADNVEDQVVGAEDRDVELESPVAPADLEQPVEDEAAIAAAVVAPKEGKKGLFSRGEKGAKPARLPKPPRAPKIKPLKEPKVPKVKKEKAPKAEEVISIPKRVVIDYYPGMRKESEAEQLARATIEKNFGAPNASYYYLQRWKDGIAVEIQEGGGKAYLPEVLEAVDRDEGAIVAIAMSGRLGQATWDSNTRKLHFLSLTEGQGPSEDAFIAYPTATMKPFDRRGSRVFVSGVALLAASLIATVFSVGAFFIDTKAWSLPYMAQTPVKDLPMAGEQMTKLQTALQSGDCIYKMEFDGGKWAMTAGFDNGGVCGLSRPAPAVDATANDLSPPADPSSSMPPVPEAMVAPGVQPMTTPPGAMPPGAMGSTASMPGTPGAP